MTQKRNLKPTDFQPVAQDTSANGRLVRPSSAKLGLALLGVVFFAALSAAGEFLPCILHTGFLCYCLFLPQGQAGPHL